MALSQGVPQGQAPQALGTGFNTLLASELGSYAAANP